MAILPSLFKESSQQKKPDVLKCKFSASPKNPTHVDAHLSTRPSSLLRICITKAPSRLFFPLPRLITTPPHYNTTTHREIEVVAGSESRGERGCFRRLLDDRRCGVVAGIVVEAVARPHYYARAHGHTLQSAQPIVLLRRGGGCRAQGDAVLGLLELVVPVDWGSERRG